MSSETDSSPSIPSDVSESYHSEDFASDGGAGAVPADHLASLLAEATLSIRSLLGGPPQRLEKPPTALEFMQIVHAGRPMLIDGILDMPGWEKIAGLQRRETWCEMLARNGKNGKVQVSVTPDGRADSLVDELFALPMELDMEVGEALQRIAQVARPLEGQPLKEIHYIQSQNSNLKGDFEPFLDTLVPSTLPFAEDALGRPPDAVNLWLGASSSFTSLHKDPYENIYVVLRGKKIFHLLPPMSWVPEMDANVARWTQENGEWMLIKEEPDMTVPWATADLTDPLLRQRFPWLKPVEVVVGPGEGSYLVSSPPISSFRSNESLLHCSKIPC